MARLLARDVFLGWGGPRDGLELHIPGGRSADVGRGGLVGAAFFADARRGLAPNGGAPRGGPVRGPGECLGGEPGPPPCPGSASLDPGHQHTGKRRRSQDHLSAPGAGPGGYAPREPAPRAEPKEPGAASYGGQWLS